MPGTRAGGFFSRLATSDSSGISWRRVFSNSSRLPRRHVYINVITTAPSASGIQPPSTILSRLAARNVKSMNRNGSINASAANQPPVPDPPDHHDRHHGGDHHGAGDGDAVGGGERARRAEQRHQQQDADQQQRVHPRHVDLPEQRFRGVADLQARQQAELDRLLRERIGAGDHRLARDHGGGGRQHHHRQQRPFRITAGRTGSRSPSDRRAPARPARDN